MLELIVTPWQALIVPDITSTFGYMAEEDIKAGFARRLNEALDDAQYPEKGKGRQVELAKAMGISQKGVRKWLESEGMPELERAIQLALMLEVATEWLLSGRGPKKSGAGNSCQEQPSGQVVSIEPGAALALRSLRKSIDAMSNQAERDDAIDTARLYLRGQTPRPETLASFCAMVGEPADLDKPQARAG